ncbi:MAG: replicative DNA helicase [Proteobacteria bacterium]|jgi:replicative DNA helicase|nr:replicative DNA helicase [Pseudomonadota bacterium]
MDRPGDDKTKRAAEPQMSEGRVPPYNKEAEEAVLGCVLLNNQALFLIQNILQPEDFYVEAHRRIYAAIQELSGKGLPVDHVTLGNQLIKQGDLEKIGGTLALEGLTERVATVANIEHYARIVRAKASVRRMIYAAQQVVAEGFGDQDDADEFLDGAEKLVFQASQARIGESYTHISRVLKKTFEDMELAAGRKGEVTGMPSGFAELDRLTAGFQAGDLVIVAGRPSMGKTALALNMAFNAAKETGVPTLVFSLEMSKEQLVRRMLSSEGRVDASKMRAPSRLDQSDWRRLTNTAGVLHQVPVYLDDNAPMTPIEIRAKSRRLMAEKGLGLIVVDYLQLMQAGGRRKDNREQEISEISRSLKGLAKELRVPIVALSQLNRSLESRPDKRPMMSDLRESGAIEQDADLIVFVYRDEWYNPNTQDKGVAEIIVGKQRSGPTGIVRLLFSGLYTRFDNLSKAEEPAGFHDSGKAGDY